MQRTNSELQNRLTNQEEQLKETQVNLKNLANNIGEKLAVMLYNALVDYNYSFLLFIVPIGFIYTQLPNQPEPHLLWDSAIWSDISSQYAGLFFRVLGGGSQTFNFTQAEQSPRITQVDLVVNAGRRNSINLPSTNVISTGVQTLIYPNLWGLRFVQSAGEVRPRNSAVRIWIRTA